MAGSGIASTLGMFVVYVLGSVTEWRNVAFYCFFVPVITMIAVCFVSITISNRSSSSANSSNDSLTDSGIAVVAVVQKPHRRRTKIVAMASRMGATESDRERIH